eukprot:scaffold53317_cov17-Prasinocladus_malaysianus.AAC.1
MSRFTVHVENYVSKSKRNKLAWPDEHRQAIMRCASQIGHYQWGLPTVGVGRGPMNNEQSKSKQPLESAGSAKEGSGCGQGAA